MAAGKIPVTVLTGFLGSGKTTLLRAALASPELADTAVIINEAGEMGLDHLLVRALDEQIFELPSGCLCCVRRLDIVTTIRDLIERRDSGAIGFRRIVIETSGLADPAPVLYTLAVDPMLGHLVACAGVVTLVDAVAGAVTLQRHPEAASQVAVADRVYISKIDLAAPSDHLLSVLDGLNGWAERMSAGTPAEVIFAPPPAVSRPRRLSAVAVAATHTDAIGTVSLVLAEAPTRFAFARALGGLASDHGNELLRVKGLVQFADRPGLVAVIHAVQHTIYRPDWLEDWPDADHRSRLVFITRGLAADVILERFAAFAPSSWRAPDLLVA